MVTENKAHIIFEIVPQVLHWSVGIIRARRLCYNYWSGGREVKMGDDMIWSVGIKNEQCYAGVFVIHIAACGRHTEGRSGSPSYRLLHTCVRIATSCNCFLCLRSLSLATRDGKEPNSATTNRTRAQVLSRTQPNPTP